MTRLLRSEAGAVLLWVAASLLLAAMVAPWLFQVGRQFAAYGAAHDLTGVLGSLAESCQRAKFSRYFDRSLLLSSLVLMPLMWRRLRMLRAGASSLGLALQPMSWPTAILHYAMGILIASGVVIGLGLTAEALGVFTANPTPPALRRLLVETIKPALGVSVVEECFFRGLLLGLWLHIARPAPACLGTSLAFAFVHFLMLPAGASLGDPSSPFAGFELLGYALCHFADPTSLAGDFLTLFVVGLILAGARLRTASLWLPMGLHCGWVIAFKIHNMTHLRVRDSFLSTLWIGENLRSGLLPLVALALTAGICHLLLKCTTCRRQV